MDKIKHQHRNPRRSTKTSTMSTSAAPAAGKVLASRTDNGSCRTSSAGGSMMVDSSPSRSSTPDAAGAPSSSKATNKYRHTREELLKLRYSPLSKLKPELCSFINKLFDGNCREADASVTDEGASVRQAMVIRKHLNLGGEPQSYPNQVNARDDVDQQIVLVPRRQSFSTGCHIASTGSVNSPDLKRGGSRRDGHRVGSGRIQISEKYLDRDLRDPRASCNRDPDQDDRHYDRAGAGSRGVKVLKRDYERRRQEGGKGGRGVGGLRSSKGDPEWFTDGPVSQSDTIELRGFDQGNSSRRNLTDAGGSSTGHNVSKVESTSDQNKEVDCVEPVAKKRGRNKVGNVRLGVVDENGEKDDHRPQEKNSPNNSASSSNVQTSGVQPLWNSSSPTTAGPLHAAAADLDFNAIFNIDSIPGLSEMFALDPEQQNPGSSRFKQWFPFTSHGDNHCEESHRPSNTDELGFLNDIICGHSGPPGTSPPPLQQPVLGAAACSAEKCSSETQNLLDMLQKAHGDAIGTNFRSMGIRNDGSVPTTPVRPFVTSADSGAYFNESQQNSVDSNVDPKTFEAGLKAILSGLVPSGPLFPALPSMAHLGSFAAGPPSGAKVLMAEDLEAQLVTAATDRSESSRAASASSPPSQPSNCRSSAGGSFAPSLLTSSCGGNNAGNPPFFSLPVLPVGTKVTMLSELEAGLKGLDVAGQAGTGGQHPDGSADSTVALPANAFANRMANLAAYKKLLGLVMDPYGGPTAVDMAQPIVTSPTSASMNSLEANQPNNSLASNQRDFIQRYVLQQQQLKMLDCSQPPPSEGIVLAPPGMPPHSLPPDVHHPLYATSSPFVDRAPSGQPIAPSSQGVNVPPLSEPSIYGYSGVGPLRAEDDLSLLPPEFCGSQLHRSPGGGGGGGVGGSIPTDERSFLLQCLENMGGKQPPKYLAHPSPVNPVNHAVLSHNAAVLNQQQQQQAAMMLHLAAQDKFKGSVKSGPDASAPRPPMAMPGAPFRPPVAHHSAGIAALPSPGIPILAPQTLQQQQQQQRPQSPRRAHSPLVFGSQPPLNLTTPLPVHLGRMTPVLSPTLSPSALQVTQPGSNPNSPVVRVPSSQELNNLAQSILQNALIKKQLEEQRERFVKRQQERNKSPNVQTSPMPSALSTLSTSGPPLIVSESSTTMNSSVLEAGKGIPSSFLPTSVLRKTVKMKMEEKLAGRHGDAEKNVVPLLNVVKPDEDNADEASDEKRNSLIDQTHPPGRQSSVTSGACFADETEPRPLATRRLLGQGLMNLNSSSSYSDAQNRQMFGEPGAAPPAIAGFAPSGRQIRGKNHLPVYWPSGSGVVRNNVGHQPSALQQQQQLNQAQFLMSSGNGPHGNAGASMNSLHALEMAKILEQRNMSLVSPVPPPPAENGAFGAKQLPRTMTHPPFGVNPSTSNGLLLQRLGLSHLQRAAFSPANPPNIDQLMRAFQQQQQQLQQQQQHMWNRNPMHPPTSNRPAFLPSSQSSTNFNASLSLANVNGVDRQNGSVVTCGNAPFDSASGRQDAFVAGVDNVEHCRIAESMLSAPGVGSLGYDMLVGGGGGGGNRQLSLGQNERAVDGGLARWFGSDVFQQNMPPPLVHADQKVLTVDEIECWQQVGGRS